MNKYLSLFRFGNGVMGIIGVAVGALLAAGTDMVDYAAWIVLGCVIAVIFIAGGNALNDYIDREIDKTAHPERPVPSGAMAPETAKNLGVGMLALAGVLSLAFGITGEGGGWTSTGIVLLCVVLMFSYETFLKQRGLVGNIDIAFMTAMVFMLGGSVTERPMDDAVFACMAFLVSVGREISKDIEDMESDKGRRTLPMSIGKDRAAIVAAVFFVLGPILSIYPIVFQDIGPCYYLVFIADAIFLYCAYIVRTDAHRAQKLAKLAMFAALIAFVLDVII